LIVRSSLALVLSACALTFAACGGSSSSTSSSSSQSTTAGETSGSTTTQSVANAEGAKIFASNCAQCHALAAAGANGQVGPNLDALAPDAATVNAKVTNGGGGMPAFGDVLTEAEIDAVSAYVADSAGQ
jgi:mono/diheme cytochrome c family protein